MDKKAEIENMVHLKDEDYNKGLNAKCSSSECNSPELFCRTEHNDIPKLQSNSLMLRLPARSKPANNNHDSILAV